FFEGLLHVIANVRQAFPTARLTKDIPLEPLALVVQLRCHVCAHGCVPRGLLGRCSSRARAEDEQLWQRVRPETVRAVDAGAGDLAGGGESGERGRAAAAA